MDRGTKVSLMSWRPIRGCLLIICLALTLQSCSWFRRGGGAEKEMIAEPAVYTPAPSTPPQQRNVRPPDAPAESPRPTGLRPAGDRMLTIYFNYDRSDLRADQLWRIEQNLEYLADNPEVKVLVEGHCDERGTTEYNFALGERRAKSVTDYFANNGISPSRIQVLSKGEEEPVAMAHAESAWGQNRRAEFKIFN